MAQRHAPFHIHTMSSLVGLKSSGDHVSGGGETAGCEPQPAASCRHTQAPTAVTLNTKKHVAIQPGCCTPVDRCSCRPPLLSPPEQRVKIQSKRQPDAASEAARSGSVRSALHSWVYLGARGGRTALPVIFQSLIINAQTRTCREKTVHRAAKASRKKALSPSSCGRLTGGRDTERTTAASQPASQPVNKQSAQMDQHRRDQYAHRQVKACDTT